MAWWIASLPVCSLAFLVGLLCRLLLLPLLAGWPERVRLVDGVVDPDEEGPASADSLFLRLRCLTGGVTPLVPGEELATVVFGVRTAGEPGVAAGVGG